MNKRTSILLAVVAAFLAGRSVHASGFLDTVVGPNAVGGGSDSDHASEGPEGPKTAQRLRYEQSLASQESRKQAAGAEYLQRYETQKAESERRKAEDDARKAAAAEQQQSARMQQPQRREEEAPDDSVVAATYVAPAVPADNSALYAAAPPKLGYPYTSD